MINFHSFFSVLLVITGNYLFRTFFKLLKALVKLLCIFNKKLKVIVATLNNIANVLNSL